MLKCQFKLAGQQAWLYSMTQKLQIDEACASINMYISNQFI